MKNSTSLKLSRKIAQEHAKAEKTEKALRANQGIWPIRAETAFQQAMTAQGVDLKYPTTKVMSLIEEAAKKGKFNVEVSGCVPRIASYLMNCLEEYGYEISNQCECYGVGKMTVSFIVNW